MEMMTSTPEIELVLIPKSLALKATEPMGKAIKNHFIRVGSLVEGKSYVKKKTP